jgi:hypothetical protein
MRHTNSRRARLTSIAIVCSLALVGGTPAAIAANNGNNGNTNPPGQSPSGNHGHSTGPLPTGPSNQDACNQGHGNVQEHNPHCQPGTDNPPPNNPPDTPPGTDTPGTDTPGTDSPGSTPGNTPNETSGTPGTTPDATPGLRSDQPARHHRKNSESSPTHSNPAVAGGQTGANGTPTTHTNGTAKQLPFTGVNAGLLAGIGGFMLLAGVALTRRLSTATFKGHVG